MPLISVIVPIYKVEPYIHRCIDSILAQTFTDFELILVDDGSPDSCGAVCDEYAEKDGRIHVIHRPNGGLSAARNTGIDWAFANSDSEWFSFIDSDDWVHPRYLELLYKAAADHNAAISRCLHIQTDRTEEVPEPKGLSICITPEEMYINWYAAFAWGKLYRRECFREIRYPDGKVFEDVAIWYKLLFAQPHVAVAQDVLYYYFVRSDSIARQEWTPQRMARIDAWEAQISFFKKRGGSLLETALDRYFEVLWHEYYYLESSSLLSDREKKNYQLAIQKKARALLIPYRRQLKMSKHFERCCELAFPVIFGYSAKISKTVKRIRH